MIGFQLDSEPWIGLLTETGMHARGLAGAFEPDVITVACSDPLENIAITRLLLAVQIAADAAGADPIDWLNTQRHRFDLFDPDQPFWQNPDMARLVDLPGTVRPIITASYRHTGNKSIAVNLAHTAAGITYSPADAARLLVTRQQFSVGGVQSFTTTAYGKQAMYAKATVGIGRPLLWLDTGRLAHSLRVTAALSADLPVGRFWFTWPADSVPAQSVEPNGVLDALTWPGRSLLLRDTTSPDVVESIMCCDGLRWPEPDKHAPDRDRPFIPHTVYARKKPSEPYTVQGVHTSRPIWRQLATMCADPENPAAPWQALAAQHGGRWRLGGLASYQSAISGPLIGDFPAPQDPTALGAFLDALTASHQRIASTVGSLTRAISDHDGYGPAIPTHDGLAAQAAPVAEELATGQITLDQAQATLNTATEQILARSYTSVATVRPLAAGRIAARKANVANRNSKTAGR